MNLTMCKDVCISLFEPAECDSFCQQSADAYEWVQGTAHSLLQGMRGRWEKLGEHYGIPGRMMAIGLIVGIAYNLLCRLRRNAESRHSILMDNKIDEITREHNSFKQKLERIEEKLLRQNILI